MDLDSYLDSKGAEYAPFNPKRAHNIFKKLKPNLCLPKKIIHIIGTNGKGSTGRFITLGLEQHNLSVFHFTSPHLFEVNERFYKNGKNLESSVLESAHLFLQQFDFIKQASYFEYLTFLALILAQDCDVLILEAGLGGEFDSTSVIESDICVFTSISYDHQEILGSKIEQIATTKLNAMAKLNFIAPQPFKTTINIAKRIAKQKQAKLIFINDEILDSALLTYAKKYKLAPFLQENLWVAKNVLDFLGKSFDFGILRAFDLPYRAYKIQKNILLDVGHNEGCAREIAKIVGAKKVFLVYNTFFQKDVYKILKILKPIIKRVLILEVLHERILPKADLINVCEELRIPFGNFTHINQESEYVVFGSFSVVKEFLERINAR